MSRFKPFPNSRPWPTSMADLEPAEKLVVWAFRRWGLGLRQHTAEHWSCVWNEFAKRFGVCDGKEALSGFTYMIKELQCSPRRTIRYHQPCCPCVGADEVCFVSFVAACQNQQSLLARVIAERMVQPDGVGGLLEAGNRLARVMRRHVPSLPQRIRKEELEAGLDWPVSSQVTVH